MSGTAQNKHPQKPISWQGYPVTVLGMSQTGMSAVDYLTQQGAQCFLSEMLPASPANAPQREHLKTLGVAFETGAHTQRCFEHSSLVIVSPGIPQHASILRELEMSDKTLISDVELAYWEAKCPFIAITGTNGKTTTTMLVSALLKAAGKSAPTCGNIGSPILKHLSEEPDVLVAELSSAQIAMTESLRCKIAVFTNFRPDHLDWHGSLDAYKQAKFQLFTGEQTPEWAVLNASDAACQELAEQTSASICCFSRKLSDVEAHQCYIALDGDVIVYKALEKEPTRLFSIASSTLPGKHNQENILAAVAVALLSGVDVATIEAALNVFQGPEHRLERVPAANGIEYYNDSKATNVDAVVCALEAFDSRRLVLIAGGRDKMTPLEPFVDAVKAHVEHVVLLGEAADRFELCLKSAGYTAITRAASLEDAVKKATAVASKETPVVFSPACSSFDMFKNYEERGTAFKRIVQALPSNLKPSYAEAVTNGSLTI